MLPTVKIIITALFCCLLIYHVSSLSDAAAPVGRFGEWHWENETTPYCSDVYYSMGVGMAVLCSESLAVTCSASLARVHHMGAIIPAIFDYCSLRATFNYKGQLYSDNSYEMMCGTGAAWMKTNSSLPLPDNVLPVGNMEDGTVLHACRALFMTGVGVVDPVTRICNNTEQTSPSSPVFDDIAHLNQYLILIQS